MPPSSHYHLVAAQLLKALRDLIADKKIMRGSLLLRELQIGCPRADQHRSSAEQLAHSFAKIVFDIDPRLWIANREFSGDPPVALVIATRATKHPKVRRHLSLL